MTAVATAAASAAFVLATLALGWVALAPMRAWLGEVGYHLAAYPTGLLAWAVVERLRGLRPARLLVALAVPLFALVGLAYGAAFIATGGWGGDKLTAPTAAAVVGGLALVTVGGGLADRVPGLGRWLTRRHDALLVAVAADAALLFGVYVLKADDLRATSGIMLGNLTSRGGYGSLWVVAAAIIVLSVAWARVWRPSTWPVLMLYSLGQFFAVAVVVHGIGHPGRFSPADSFARVAFHAVPLVFWYGGVFAAGLARAWGTCRDAEEGR